MRKDTGQHGGAGDVGPLQGEYDDLAAVTVDPDELEIDDDGETVGHLDVTDGSRVAAAVSVPTVGNGDAADAYDDHADVATDVDDLADTDVEDAAVEDTGVEDTGAEDTDVEDTADGWSDADADTDEDTDGVWTDADDADLADLAGGRYDGAAAPVRTPSPFVGEERDDGAVAYDEDDAYDDGAMDDADDALEADDADWRAAALALAGVDAAEVSTDLDAAHGTTAEDLGSGTLDDTAPGTVGAGLRAAAAGRSTTMHGAPAARAGGTGGDRPWRDSLVVAEPPRSRRGRLVLVLLALALVAAAAVVLTVTRGNGGEATGVTATTAAAGAATTPAPTLAATTAAPTTPAPTTTPATTVPATTVPATTVPATTIPATTIPATTAAPAPATAAPNAAAAAAAEAGIPDIYTPVRWAIFQGGKVRLLGRVPSQQVAETIATKAAAVVGPGNVSIEYLIDPTAPVPPAAPLYVRDTVQFAPGSFAVAPQFRPLLDLGVRLMSLNPGVRIWVMGRTDSVGDPDANLMLSLRRAQAVISYLGNAGIDESRITAVPLGSDAALADNDTAEGRQQNRSVEFVISGLLA